MVQMTLDALDRQETKARLHTLERYIYDLMIEDSDFREIKNRNALIRYVWEEKDAHLNAESVTRIQRKILAEHPELDTPSNQAKRANRECAMREFVSPRIVMTREEIEKKYPNE
jgi:hypothetical protein